MKTKILFAAFGLLLAGVANAALEFHNCPTGIGGGAVQLRCYYSHQPADRFHWVDVQYSCRLTPAGADPWQYAHHMSDPNQHNHVWSTYVIAHTIGQCAEGTWTWRAHLYSVEAFIPGDPAWNGEIYYFSKEESYPHTSQC